MTTREHPRDTTPDPRLDAWIREFAEAESRPGRLDAWVERIAAPIVDDVDLRDDAALAHAAVATIRAHWVAFLASLPEPAAEVRLVAPAVELAREVAQRGLPLTTVFRVYRLAQSAVWQHITTIIDTVPPGELATRALVHFWGRASAWIDASIDQSTEIWQEERDRVVRSTAARRLDVVRDALTGEAPDARTLAKVLDGHPVSSHNTGVLLHAAHADGVGDLDAAAQRLARALGTRAPLVVTPGGRDLWLWLATQAPPDLTRLHTCDAWLAQHELTAAVGEPGEGVEGFRLSHREAQEAQRVAFEADLRRPLTLYAEVELLCLLSASRDAARRFALRTLGGLAGDDETSARLRQTLHALLRTGSVDKASHELSVHKNTVRYRVGQAEELMGHPVDERSTEVELALRYYDAFVAAAREA